MPEPPPSQAPGALVTAPGMGLAAIQSSEGAALAQRQVQELHDAMLVARRAALAQVMGRQQLAPGDAPPPVATADDRILEVLLSMSPLEWPDAVADACTPAEDEGEPSDGEEQGPEMLSTTPLRLLQAIDASLSRLERGRSEAGDQQSAEQESDQEAWLGRAQLPGEAIGRPARMAQLTMLRRVVEQLAWKDPSESAGTEE